MSAWDFLQPYLAEVEAFVFSRSSYLPPTLPAARTWVIPPSIDPFSPKNQPMDSAAVRATLAQIGILAGDPPGLPGRFTRRDGSPGEVSHAGSVVADELPNPGDPVVMQVSRWDRLKDMAGVMRGFVEHVAPNVPGWLVLAGPSVDGVADDPEGGVVLAQALALWHDLPARQRSRVILVTLPMSDVDENAAMVNALQRHASVIVQKSVAEGFGLTVAEGMWKGKPVVGSAVGGIQDQVAPGTGILLSDPQDLPAFGRAVRRLLEDPALARRMGAAAREHVRARYVGDLHLLRYAELFSSVLQAARLPGRSPVAFTHG
jgi:trehalose synthase